MGIFKILLELITMPAIILGLIALIGLLMQRKPAVDVVTGTIKTILGLLIMSVGIGALIGAIIPIQAMFEAGIPAGGFTTFITFDEAVVGAVQDANIGNIGAAIAWTMLFGYIIHLLLARFTKFKFVYLTGHMIWIHAGAFAILFHSFGLSLLWTVVFASIVDGLYMTLAPALAQPVMRKIVGSDEIGFGHGQTLMNMVCAWVGKLIGNPEDSAEDTEMADSMSFFRDMAVSISLIMILTAFVAVVLAIIQVGISGVEETISGGQNWFVYTLMQALGFTAGVLVLLQGVRMLIAEIVPAFKGVADTLIPGAIPALSWPSSPVAPVQFSVTPRAANAALGQVASSGVLPAGS